jgi:hypothetical protein
MVARDLRARVDSNPSPERPGYPEALHSTEVSHV